MSLQVTSNDFESEVKKSNLPVIVDFYADWCVPCKRLAPMLDKLAQEFEGQIKVVKVDADKDQSLALDYRIQGLPTLILFKDGEVLDRVTGLLQEPQLKEFAKQGLSS